MLDNSMPDSYHFSSNLFSLVNEKVYFIFYLCCGRVTVSMLAVADRAFKSSISASIRKFVALIPLDDQIAKDEPKSHNSTLTDTIFT